MTESIEQTPPVPPEKKDESAEIFSVSQDKNGSFHFSRRDFLALGMAGAGVLIAKGMCPRFGEGNTASISQPVQAGMMPLPKVYLHAGPSIESDILETLQPNDLVLLVVDHAETGWTQVLSRNGKQGWLKRMFVDFSKAVRRATPTFTLPGTGLVANTPGLVTARLIKNPTPKNQAQISSAGACGNPVLNGDFESGHVNWVEESTRGTNSIITNTWSTPYGGSYVALLGHDNSVTDKLTQVIHLPADLSDTQSLEFYIQSDTTETSTIAYDRLVFRLLDNSGGPLLINDVAITDNTESLPSWMPKAVQLTGMASLAGQDIQIQFEAHTDSSLITNFVLDAVVFNLDCTGVSAQVYVYLPIVMNAGVPTPTETPCAADSCSCNTSPCSCNTSPCSCNTSPCPTNTTCPNYVVPCPGNSVCPPVNNCPLYVAPCNSNSFCPPVTNCPLYVVPCNSNSFCPPVNNCPLYVIPCTANSYCPPVNNCPLYTICTCNLNPCSCNSYPCACNLAPCSCNLNPCTCNISPCSCNSVPVFCTCNSFPCPYNCSIT